ncbi:cellulase [Acinetobacter qingfengensis]|uniref:cellulase n=2 Tax=Acinetobacter qingfengensis TaxID=1262585 RepID=A0A1E7R8X7_9GAMM|nr:cellulase [Acinetobacter qingfengensis]OEY95778.1 endo-1,4-D-glucanase [Acinetobacter qingfengensis]
MSRSVFANEVNFDLVWKTVKQQYISEDGRVIDYSDQRFITTSEGQSYAMFFALVNNDQKTFDKLLRWTENNLAQGDLQQHLPAWLWGKDQNQEWKILDPNSASDADLWIVWNLIEAGRLWKNQKYTDTADALLQQIEKSEVVNIPDLGDMLLPGQYGFVFEKKWRLNPCYLPVQILTGIANHTHAPLWINIKNNSVHLLIASAPKGFSPDWIEYDQTLGWLTQVENKPILGSYDAIRVYLWLGMLNSSDQNKQTLYQHFMPMLKLLNTNHYPPEKINVLDATTINQGPIGFSAAMLPFIQDPTLQKKQLLYIQDNYKNQQNYYNNMLILFGLGWYEKKFAFSATGQLLPAWNHK